MPDLSDSPFDALEASFRLGCRGPRPWSIDGRAVAGLPERDIPFDELKAILLHPSTPHFTRDRTLAVLVERSRLDGGAATVGLAGVLLPGLRRALAPLCGVYPERAGDLEAEALAGLLEGVARAEPGQRFLAAWLCWLARNRARRLFVAALAERGRTEPHLDADPPRQPWGHPDFVLAHAVDEGILSRDDAALIGDTRLGGVRFETAAAALGISYQAARWRRVRAEKALKEWLASDSYRRTFVTNPAPTPYFKGGDRRRGGRDHNRQPKSCQSPNGRQGGDNRPSR
jgi:DNA-directed RNA polymerase specialized sigma24 family protein